MPQELPLLSKSFLHDHASTLDPQRLAEANLPIRVLQFGEGAFLRGFVDWMVHRMNRSGVFQGKVVVIQPIPTGTVSLLNQQDGLFTLLRRGIEQGKPKEEWEVISSISHGIDPYIHYQAFLDCASIPELRFIISNTTEAGIVLDPEDRLEAVPPRSFPGKLTRFLWERYLRFRGNPDKGFIILPCELIERNGDTLKRTVLTLAENWTRDGAFLRWVEDANVFCNTLVDGIMTGYPKDEIEELQKKCGYRDALFDTGEWFRLWVIEGPEQAREEFPLHQANLPVVWTHDVTPYRTRKVRILNGIHTMTAPAAILAGVPTVREALEDPLFSSFIRKTLYGEILPVLPLPKEEVMEFAESVLERFSNPHIRHFWTSIALNSAAKFTARVLPTILEYPEKFHRPPHLLSWAFACLLVYYRGLLEPTAPYLIQDDAAVLSFFKELWGSAEDLSGIANSRAALGKIAAQGCSPQAPWGPVKWPEGWVERVTLHLQRILAEGIRASLQSTLQEGGS